MTKWDKNIFIVKLVKDNGSCGYKPGHYLVKTTSEWLNCPSLTFDPREAEVFSSFKSAEKCIKNWYGVGFTFEIIEFTKLKATIIKN